MPAPLTADRLIDPTTLSPAQRTALTGTLYAVHNAVFSGVSRDTFRQYVVDSDAQRTRIQRYRNAAGDVVGYAAIHWFAHTLASQSAMVMRCEVGMLPAYRGQSAAWMLLAREVFTAQVRYPLHARFLVASPVHPASYYALARTVPGIHPRPTPTPPKMRAALSQLDSVLEMPRPEGVGPHVRSVGWITRQTAAEQAFWQNHHSDLVRFYLSENPDYESGTGLRIACSLSLSSFVGGLSRMVTRLFTRRLRKLLSPVPASVMAGGER